MIDAVILPKDSRTVHGAPILLTGATGYIGGRLLRASKTAAGAVRCLARSRASWHDGADHRGRRRRLPRRASLDRAFDGVDTAYYLVHSMGARREFADAIAAPRELRPGGRGAPACAASSTWADWPTTPRRYRRI